MSELLLAIETSTRAVSLCAARFERGATQLLTQVSRELPAAIPLTSRLIPEIQDALAVLGHKAADVRVAAFSRGPGSFTGLRAAAAVMRMLQSTTGCEVVGVATFESIADAAFEWLESDAAPPNARSIERVVVLAPAKAGFVFAAAYSRADLSRADRCDSDDAPRILAIDSWRGEFEAPFAVVADARIPQNPDHTSGSRMLPAILAIPTAERIARLALRRYARGATMRPEEIVPLYGRKPECEEVYGARRAEARSRRDE
ncbi:MAG: tRNA (adenosine(37)-N6)-threonylcarbamoyltransferase complex dimerization subunit type 1 TsaB [Phycisphaerales bacterium]|nr:tRNA (adenosine(37)-N6)-threonylcarbamoyltransferase complex dimerization subunit type 1 TsaB [Phycisphaerales bacterium]